MQIATRNKKLLGARTLMQHAMQHAPIVFNSVACSSGTSGNCERDVCVD